ncbi:MAG: hypothetical protein VR64_15565 [Desulfatitalea sp. BRH_c12]|nr:MAG: hypothetical protein VR64_15565 [Desulfatitalea sp. BRH_c12]
MPMVKKIVRWSLGVLSALMILVAALHFLLPWMVNTPAIKEKVAAYIDRTLGGQTHIVELRPHLLPMPGITLKGIQLSLPGRAEMRADLLSVYPGILPLFTGRLQVGAVRVHAPMIELRAPTASGATAPSFDVATVTEPAVVQSVLRRLPENVRVSIDDGQVTVAYEGQSLIQIQAIEAMLQTDGRQIALELEGQSAGIGDFYLQAALDSASMNGSARVDLADVSVSAWETALRPGSRELLPDAVIDLHVTAQVLKWQTVKLAFNGSAPQMTFRGQNDVDGRGLLVEGNLHLSRQALSVTLDRLQATQPQLNANASLTWPWEPTQTAPLQLTVQARDSDVTALRAMLQKLIGGHAGPQTLMRVIQGGTLVHMDLNTAGDSVAALGRMANLHISGAAADAHIVVPEVDLDLTEVSGDWQFSDGVLTARNAVAQLGASRGGNGTLTLGLQKDNRFIDLEVDISADLAQLPPILKKLIKQPAVRGELERITNAQGTADGHLSLSGPFKAMNVTVTARNISLSAAYDRLPFPVALQGDTVTFTRDSIAFNGIAAQMKNSTIEHLKGHIKWHPTRQIAVDNLAARLALDQLYPWLTAFPGLKAALADIDDATGRLTLRQVRLHGLLNRPAQWQFEASGSMQTVTLSSARLPGPLTVVKGRFTLTPEQFSLADARLHLLDGTLEGSATVGSYRSAQPTVRLTAKGIIGARGAGHLQDLLQVPSELRVRAPISVQRLSLSRDAQDETRMEGDFKLPGDLNIATVLSLRPEEVNLRDLTITDRASRAQMTLQHDLGNSIWRFSYNGRLLSATLVKLWRDERMAAGDITGDITGFLDFEHPEKSIVKGQLEGHDIVVPDTLLGTVLIPHIVIEGLEDTLSIQRLAFVLDQQYFLAEGQAFFKGEQARLKMSLSSDDMDLALLKQRFDSIMKARGADAGDRGRPFDLAADIDIHVNRLSYQQFVWEPMHATLTLKEGAAEMTVRKASLCGISTMGSLRWTPETMSIELLPKAENQTLQYAEGCLIGGDSTERIEGTYAIDGRLTTHGTDAEALTRNLQGMVHFDAVDGRVFNAGEVGLFTNLLSFLHVNNLIKRDLPNLSERDYQFNRIRLDLRFQGGRAELQEAQIDSHGLNMVGEGDIDLLNRRLNLSVLVSPLTTLDSIIRYIPLVGNILKGTLVAIPVGVRGPLANPRVTPLSPKAVGQRLLGIMERTLKTPFRLIEPILPSQEERQEQ